MDPVNISFDESYRIRVLESGKFDQTRALEENCSTFVQKIEAFNATVHSLVEVLSTQADAIEKEKLRAIGIRNLAEAEPELRERKKKEIRALISEKRAALNRLQRQYDSLVKVEGEQAALIEKLSNNEA
eukprot:Plantae.Rhodophyta-Rhodochaete_pulchella.ctg29445.p1 GENE.Plantae.Rhodophyta-Rhodochaete_pulchella.ctg29445~~Plantae.Rhodophyta-Rhodochaete_pulchella.ctg29445.p1  ORF type:complete len:129 (+),score=31.55 Plantae.Rhodophyta-Rhodochaete_pulchella.ctg29445:34-420(+)